MKVLGSFLAPPPSLLSKLSKRDRYEFKLGSSTPNFTFHQFYSILSPSRIPISATGICVVLLHRHVVSFFIRHVVWYYSEIVDRYNPRDELLTQAFIKRVPNG